MSRTVGHRIHGRIEVFAFADSIGEAFALENALKRVPVFASDGGPLPVAPPDESELPPVAFADADDNVGDLKAGEAHA